MEGGSGWESNPPRLPLQHPSDGFEDRGAHRDSTTPILTIEYPVLPDPSKSFADCVGAPTQSDDSERFGSAPPLARAPPPFPFDRQILQTVRVVHIYKVPEQAGELGRLV